VTPEPTRAGGAAVDALLDPGFLEAAVQRPMADVRRLRRQAEQEEVNLSYTRRLLQGRLDIVRRELQRRAEHDGRSLVDLLPEILSEKGRGPAHGLGRHQTVQPTSPEQFESWVNGLAPGVDLSDVPSLPDAELEKAARSLAEGERGLSERRRGVQQVMDAVAGELARRYRDGLADVAQLLADESRHRACRRTPGPCTGAR
jgi:hypothetical protein